MEAFQYVDPHIAIEMLIFHYKKTSSQEILKKAIEMLDKTMLVNKLREVHQLYGDYKDFEEILKERERKITTTINQLSLPNRDSDNFTYARTLYDSGNYESIMVIRMRTDIEFYPK